MVKTGVRTRRCGNSPLLGGAGGGGIVNRGIGGGGVISYGAPQVTRSANRQIYQPQQIHMLVCANDYKGTSCPLSCTHDGQNIAQLAQHCGIQVHLMQDRQLTVDGFQNALAGICQQCRAGDLFIFFFAGHGMQVTDYDGDEPDGHDEAYVMVDQTGSIFDAQQQPIVFTDDEFARTITSYLDPSVPCILISDCCHSGSIADLHKPCWDGRVAISISGCRDTQTSGDTGTGGICTFSMLLAVESLQAQGKTQYSVAKFMEEVLRQDDGVFDSEQDITCNTTTSCTKKTVMWPLCGKGNYRAPPLPGRYHKIGLPGQGPQIAPAGTPISALTVYPNPSYASHVQAQPVAKPIYQGGSPIYQGGSPIYQGGSPIYQGGSPIYQGGTNIYQGGTNIYEGGAPIYQGGSPAIIQGGSPIYQGGISAAAPQYVTSGGTPYLGGGYPVSAGSPYVGGGGGAVIRYG